MPTYEFRCPECGATRGVAMTVQEYADLMEVGEPIRCIETECCGAMQRAWSSFGVRIR